MINSLGRPLEFHCTLPVMPSRAQTILYGATLDTYFCGEQIGRALVQRAKTQPGLLLTDCEAVLAIRHVYSLPCILIEDVESEGDSSLLRRPTSDGMVLERMNLGPHRVGVLGDYAEDHGRIRDIWKLVNLQIDPREPFGRIREALMEAHPASKAA